MSRLARWSMRLYPARWRSRYGDELDALLGDTGADARIVLDLLRGGIRMQFSTWSFAKLAVILGIGGLALGAAGSFLITPTYVSKAVVRVEREGGNAALPGDTRAALVNEIQRITPLVLSRSSLASIINGPDCCLYREELKTTPLETVIQEMQNAIRVEPLESSNDARMPATTVQISFEYFDPQKARDSVGALIQRFKEESRLVQHDAEGAVRHDGLVVIDTASLPVLPVYPIGDYMALAGLVAGVLLAFLWRKKRRRGFTTRRYVLATVLLGMSGATTGCVVYQFDLRAQEKGEDSEGVLPSQRYRSSALMSIQNRTPEQMRALIAEGLSRTSLAAFINGRGVPVYTRELKTRPLEDVLQIVRQNLTITPDSSGRYLNIAFVYRNRYTAQRVVQGIMNQLEETSRGMSGSTAESPVLTRFTVLDAPSMPILPVKPNRYMMTGTGGAGGLLVAGVVALVRRRWRPEEEIPIDTVNG